MKLQAVPPPHQPLISACGEDHITLGGLIYRHSILITSDGITAWAPDDFSHLTPTALQQLLDQSVDVLLLGTGSRQQFPAPELLAPFFQAGRPIEIMSTPAACRTWNILVAEERRVAAALILEPRPSP